MTKQYKVERDGFSFVVPKDHHFKFELLEGPQILDVAIWGQENPQNEFLSMSHTLWMNDRKITKGSTLWSDYKVRRIIAKCIDETEYESSKDGCFHHLLAGYCDDEENQGRGSCKTNFLNSIKEFGLGVEHLNDNTINLFEKVKPAADGYRLEARESDCKKGDYITFKSYIDLIISVSLCPSVDFINEYHFNPENSKPIRISVYE